MGIKVEYNPDLALRSIEEYKLSVLIRWGLERNSMSIFIKNPSDG